MKLADLRATSEAMAAAPWYSAESRWQPDCVLTGAPDVDMTSDGRVVVQANPNSPYRANLDGIAALRNHATAMLDALELAERLVDGNLAPGDQHKARVALRCALAKLEGIK